MKFITNMIHIVAETFSNPNKESLIELETGDFVPLAKNRTRDIPRSGALLTPRFKWTLIVVVGITLASGLAQTLLAGLWPSPTPNEQSTFEAFSFAWKTGIGAIFGLLGGKTA